ncbi:MAG: hypothetical protein KDC27_20470 [Acidobacteria bacterium]|nr:hypothetical protein [Acidobacteriota bacterium]
MGLAAVQAAVARLLVDAVLRKRFLEDPAGAAVELGVSVREAAQIAHTRGLAPFADSLIRKRLSSVRQLLPRSAEQIGARFDRMFCDYARTEPSRGPRRHERDALALAAILEPDLEGDARRALAIESGWLEAAAGKRLVVRRLRPGFAVWLRVGRGVRFWRAGARGDWTSPPPAARESE